VMVTLSRVVVALSLAGGLGTAGPLAAQAAGQEPVRRLLDGLRGASPVQCELALRSLDFWSGWNHPIPDRDSEAGLVVAWVDRTHKDPAVVAPLAAALKDPDGCVRRLAVRLLGRVRLPAARARLLEALRDTEPETRRLGAIGLGFSNDRTAVPQLVRALQDRDPRVRAAAAWAIGAVH